MNLNQIQLITIISLDVLEERLIQDIKELGVNLSENVYKARIANSNKDSGKSGGYRLITYLKLLDKKLILIYIYDKSNFENISESEIDRLVLESLK